MEEKKTVSISGSGSFAGGSYSAVRISGCGKCTEPFTADSVRVAGTASLAAVEAKALHISGSTCLGGRVAAERLSASGSLKIEEDCEAAELEISGSMHAHKNLRGTNGSIRGSIRVGGDMEFERLTLSGSADVSGLLNADALNIHLGGGCRIGEIGGTEIFVDVPPFRSVFFKWLFGRRSVPSLKCGTIEGERIRLENTVCDTVRGKNIVIAPGCRIGLIEYSGELTVDPSSRVDQEEKVHAQDK